ncbi:MAG: hypothetical protein AAGC73_06540 [Verrucomicrobiota bacterium]
MNVTSTYNRQRRRAFRSIQDTAEAWTASSRSLDTAQIEVKRPLCPSAKTLERLARYHRELKKNLHRRESA